MKMRIFIIKNGFIIFKSILQHDLYTSACAQITCRSTFSTPIETPPKHVTFTATPKQFTSIFETPKVFKNS